MDPLALPKANALMELYLQLGLMRPLVTLSFLPYHSIQLLVALCQSYLELTKSKVMDTLAENKVPKGPGSLLEKELYARLTPRATG